MSCLPGTGGFPPRILFSKFRRRSCNTATRIPVAVFYTQKAAPPPVGDDVEDAVLEAFLRERKVNGDFVTRFSDGIWVKGMIQSSTFSGELDCNGDSRGVESRKLSEEGNVGGFLKLKGKNEWLLGDDDNSPPVNQKIVFKELRDDSGARRRLNFLQYEALKKELLLLTLGIGTACSGYCLVVFSVQASLSYATGVLFSLLYFHLLCRHVDSISREAVPQIFTKTKSKKIGIRSEDIANLFERTVKGSSVALSSPRLIIPAAIYAIWGLCQHFSHGVFDFQLVPAMVGLFAYKAAALVQVYRDNEDLQLVFPETEDQSS